MTWHRVIIGHLRFLDLYAERRRYLASAAAAPSRLVLCAGRRSEHVLRADGDAGLAEAVQDAARRLSLDPPTADDVAWLVGRA